MRLSAKERKRLNKAFYELGKTYHEEIPLSTIRAVLRLSGSLDILQEDGTPWSGFLLGEDGNANFHLGFFEPLNPVPVMVIMNTRLIMSWHRMQSGRYEVVVYLS